MSSEEIDLLIGSDRLQLHNASRTAAGGSDVVTGGAQWSYALSLPVALPAMPGEEWQPQVVVGIEVLEGTVGVGVLDVPMQRFVTSEVDVAVSERPATIILQAPAATTAGHLMIRNTASSGSSRFRLSSARARVVPIDRRLLIPSSCPDIPVQQHAQPLQTAMFDVLISHSSRRWNAAECEQTYLRHRYARPGRLSDLPPFESLPANVAPYHGLLSVFRVHLGPAGATGRLLQHYASPEKVVHAAIVGESVAVCFDAGLALFERNPGTGVEVVPESAERVGDPWFGGLHTVAAVDDRSCLVSSSGADAVLWLDVPSRKVVRRWRLPAERYGSNYSLTETSWLSEHYVPNDLQLGHLNCAAPDGRGGAYFSVLGQGDIGRVDATGAAEVIVTGYVGCHSVRCDGERVYFSDSCNGRLMRVDGRDRATVLFDTGSRWLHDSVHLGNDLFLMTLGDTNRLLLADAARNTALAEWNFAAVDGTVQFLSVIPQSPRVPV